MKMFAHRLASHVAGSKRAFTAVVLSALAATTATTAFGDVEEPTQTPIDHVLPRNAMPMKGFTRAGAPRSEAPLAPACTLTYQNGPVIANVEVVAVWWGAVDSTISDASAGLPAFYTSITNSAYFDWLSEYNTSTQTIGRGTFKSAVQVTPSLTSKSLSDTQIGNEIVAQINAGKLPKPSADAKGNYNTLYMIDFPAGITITLQGTDQSCVQFCAFHSTATYNGKDLGFGVHPYMGTGSKCATGCGDNAKYIDNVTSVHAHEMIEAVTDVGVGNNDVGWYADATGCGEIGDICDTGHSSVDDDTINGWRVQKEWSNKHNSCIAYAKCASNADCPATAKTCNTTTGQCVQCTTNKDCSAGTPICDTKAGTCRACSADTDCASPTAHCDTTADANKGKCVECTTNAQCPATKPVCTADACTSCTSDTDCAGNAAGTSCNTSTGACGAPPASNGSGDGGSGSGDGTGNSNSSSDQFGSTGSNGGCGMSAAGDDSPVALALGVGFVAMAIARGKKKKLNK